MNILKDLYYGDLEPIDKGFDRNSEYAKLFTLITDNEKKLIDFLNSLCDAKEEQNLLSQMQDAQYELNNFIECERFIDGFRMGAEFILETFVVPQRSVIRDIS